jgi:hypothetical protein
MGLTEMYIDDELRKLPVATASRRFGAYVLDRLLLLLVPAFAALFVLPLYLLIQAGISSLVAKAISGLIIASVFLFTLIYGNWLRVWDNGQTLGMSLMNIAIASDHSQFKSTFMNRWFFWVNIATKDMKKSWAGDELEERTDAQLWRGLLPTFMYPMLAGVVLIVLEAVGRLPFVIGSLIGWAFSNGEFNLSASNKYVALIIALPIVVTFIIAELGFLLALGKEARTLGDHFLGIKLVDVHGTKYSYQPKGFGNLMGWFMGNKERELQAS